MTSSQTKAQSRIDLFSQLLRHTYRTSSLYTVHIPYSAMTLLTVSMSEIHPLAVLLKSGEEIYQETQSQHINLTTTPSIEWETMLDDVFWHAS